MKIGILTGGGDVPGLNPCIKAVVTRVLDDGHEIVGIRRGWAGLLECQVDDPESIKANMINLNLQSVRTVDRSGGTFLHTSRTNPSKVMPEKTPEMLKHRIQGDGPHDFTQHILDVIEKVGIDVLIPIGGDDTLSYALRMHDEGIPVVAIPKTMDNDVNGTDYCIGFSTAVTRSVGFIHNLRTSAGSHERIAVIELFGRYSGATSLIAAYLSGVDRAIITEVPFDPERLANFLVQDRRTNPSNYAMVTISEGASIQGGEMVMHGKEDAYGHKKLGGIGAVTGDLIKQYTGANIIYQQIAYLMRSGNPDSLDLMVGFNYATMAADLVIHGNSGRLVALRDGIYTNVPLAETGEGVKGVDVDALYDSENYRPRVRKVEGMPMFLS
ncbi:MAG: phosphofructokinase [Anaerolineales bacterium]|nr:MAG: phosphofructokinase [Anaerolineales bacterium]